MPPTWRLLRCRQAAPEFNMAVDEAVLTAVSEGRSLPTVRFYGWNPPTLSIGYFQRGEAEVELERVKQLGLGFVRRPTGGRAVLHDRELTYSIIVAEEYPGIPQRVTEAYRVLSEGLLHGFRGLGLQAEMADLSADGEKSKYDAPGSAACFDSPSWYELVVEGRKAAGSAQLRQKGVVLQHGSVLLDLDVPLLFSLLKFRTPELRERMMEGFKRRAVAINELREQLGMPPVELVEAEEVFRTGMETGLGIRLEEAELSGYERELADRLAIEKYGSDTWNLRK
ncbi:MAG: octanoyltransferase LipM [Paenibacillaceae bacterium]|nr:octanoyltransferase LipM [Paenibacillaceae bacterium]